MQGLLLMKRHELCKDYFRTNKFLLSWLDWIDDNNLSAYQSSLVFISSNKLIDKFLIGVDNYDQFKQLIDFCSLKKN